MKGILIDDSRRRKYRPLIRCLVQNLQMLHAVCVFTNICVTNDHGYVPFVVNTSRFFPHSWLITGFVTRLTRRAPPVEQKLSTLPEHLSLPPVFSEVHVTPSLVLCVCFVNRCWFFCPFSFGHCVICPSIYGFWLPLLYLQTLVMYAYIFFIRFSTDIHLLS